MSDNGSPNMQKPEDAGQSEHLNIKVTDNNNEVFFKIKRTTQLKKLMDAFCDRQGKNIASVRFLFDGQRVQPTDNPETVRDCNLVRLDWRTNCPFQHRLSNTDKTSQLDMQDGDTLEVHQEQIGGGC
jgi:hypothetical protein